MPGPGQLGEVLGEPGQPLLGRSSWSTARCSDSRSSEPRSTRTSVPELLGDVGGDPGVGGRRRGEHRDAGGQVGEHLPDAAVVGPEVVAPVGDAVRLVDDEQPGGLGQLGQHLVAEAGVVQPLGADQQHVDLAGVDRVADRLPVLDVGRVDGGRADAGPLGRLDLVAHQREQRRDDHRRPGTESAQQGGRDEVDRRLAPAGPLHDEHPALLDRRAPRSPPTGRRAAGRRRGRPAHAGASRPGGVRLVVGRGHPDCLPAAPDNRCRP